MLSLLALTLASGPLSHLKFQADPGLDAVLEKVVEQLSKDRNEPKLKSEIEIAAASVDRANSVLSTGAYRADGPMYPCSVVKMFYMVYAYDLYSRESSISQTSSGGR